jgi:hypothetical protein
MLLTRGRRPGRQRWLGVPIGMFIHLVLDGTWTDTGLFWWPVAGMDELGGSVVPEFDRLPGTLLLEALGLLVGAWAWRRFGMSDPLNRRRFWSEGRLVGIAGRPGHENDRRGS